MIKFIQPNIILYFFLLLLGVGGFLVTVIWPQPGGFYAFIVLAAAGGFGVSWYIFHKKRGSGQLVCPTGSDCNAVITSRYSKFLGIPIEYLGMIYYFLIVGSYLCLIFLPQAILGTFLSVIVMLSAGAFLFSIYLLFAQAFLLRKWCIWCLLSAMLSIAIFIVSLISVDWATTLLANMSTFFQAIHGLGFVLGLGSATAGVLLFLKFMNDRKIDDREFETMQKLFELIWLGLILTVMSQLTFYVTDANMIASGPFLVQTLVLVITAIATAALMIIFAPFLSVIPFSDSSDQTTLSPLASLRKPVFMSGAIALSSWFFAFVMDYMPEFSANILFPTYVMLLATAVFISLMWERRMRLAP